MEVQGVKKESLKWVALLKNPRPCLVEADLLTLCSSSYPLALSRTYNCLDDPELREGIKEYSSWPTIPQVYVNGEFVGGCDIMLSSE